MASPENPVTSPPPVCREVTKELLESVLTNFHASQQPDDIKILDWKSNKPSGNRLGFLSEQATVSVQYQAKGKDLSVHLLFKFLPEDPEFKALQQENLFFLREVKFYTEILPHLVHIEKTYLSEEDMINPWIPTFYYGKCDELKETLLAVENMSPKGYKVGDFNEGLSYAETKSSLIAIANFHAVAVALEVKDGQLLQERFPFLFPVEKAVECFGSLVEGCIPSALKLFESLKEYEAVREGLIQYVDNNDVRAVLRRVITPSGKLNTLLHHDYWCNNLLLKTAGDDIHSCIIDWQTLAYGSPALDVSAMIWSSLTPSVRRQYTQTLRSDYWEAFTSRLAKLKVDIETLNYTRKDFEGDFKSADLLAGHLVISSIDMAANFTNLKERQMEVIADLVNDGLFS